MSSKVATVAMFMLLVGLVGSPAAVAADPSLVGWWQFDGDTLDSSGNGRDGSLVGDAQLVDNGLFGGALALDGSGDYVNIDGYLGILAVDGVQNPFTVACWLKTTGNAEMVTWGNTPGGQRLSFRIDGGTLRTEHGSGNLRGNTTVNDGEWHHAALVVAEGANLRVPNTLLYADGVEDTTYSGSDNTYNLTGSQDVSIGRRATSNDRFFNGMIDDVRIYDRALAAEEIAELAKRPKSYSADPAVGSLVEATSALLQWLPGGFATQHDVYVGTSADLGPADLAATQTETSFSATDLVQEQTYYWRIDDVEADGTVRMGDVWNFWVPPQRAYAPQPSDALINVVTDAQLSWTGGWSPLMHTVYFGTDKDTVASAAGGMPQMDTTYDPGPLEVDTAYYWRVDEFYNGQWVASPVWSFTTLPAVPPVEDPSLVAWYTLDEGAGRTAIDWSGNGGHGQLTGDVVWAEGIDGGALAFDGSGGDYAEAPDAANVTGTHSRTVAAWIKTADYGEIASWGQDLAGQKWIFRVQESNGTLGAIRVEVNGGYQVGSIDVRDDEWHHTAAVLADDGSPDVTEIALYVDGFLEANSAQLDEPINTAAGVVRIGQSPWGARPFAGLIDDGRIYDTAFSEDEMRQMFGDVLIAWQPQPEIGAAMDVLTFTSVSWTAGDGAVEHDVYLSTDPDALAAADASDTTGVYRGRQAETTYVPPEDLSLGATYYWRVDEVGGDGAISAGRTWTFTVADTIAVNEAETALDYDNTVDPFVTQVTFDVVQDWTNEGFADLSLEFQGNPPVFVEDADGVITMSGAGNDIWGNSDQFRYAFTEISGDATITARVLSNGTGSVAWAKGGVMIRQSLDGDSVNVCGAITGGDGNGGTFQWRSTPAAASDSSRTLTGIAPPYWVRLVRAGDTFTVEMSADGVDWVQEGETPIDVAMVDPVLIGLAVTSHASGEIRAFQFDNVSINGAAVEALEVVDVGVDQGGNDPASLYVAVADAAGGSALVIHPDLAATNLTGWNEWRIPLADLAAADLSAVAKVTVGVGDGEPDGTGTVLVRNMQVVPPAPPVITVSPAESVETTGDDGMVLSINGIPAEELILGTTTTDFEKHADHLAPDADDFDLGTYASLDDSSFILMSFPVPVDTVFIVERGANDLGLIQPLDAAGDPVGGVQAFAKDDWFKPGIKVSGQDAGAIVVTSAVPISGIMVLPAEDALMGLDPASVSAIAAE